MPRKQKSPQETKRDSYEKDRRNTYGENVPSRATVLKLAACFAIAIQSLSANAQAAGGAKTVPVAAWYQFLKTADIVAYLDTARVERLGPGRARVWFRFEYINPITLGADSTHIRAGDTRDEIDCPKREVKDLELILETTSGVSISSPMGESKWISMDAHPMHSGIFFIACRAIGSPLTRTGSS